MLALRMQATTDQVKQQETSLYSDTSSDASECGVSVGDESVEESDGGEVLKSSLLVLPVVQICMETMILT